MSPPIRIFPDVRKSYTDNALFAALHDIVGDENCIRGESEAATPYRRTARQNSGEAPRGSCLAVIKPHSEDELQKVVTLINQAKPKGPNELFSLVVQGGNTAAALQSCPSGKQIVVSMEHFNQCGFDPKTNNITIGAGVTIDQARALLQQHEREIPVRVGIWGTNAQQYPDRRGTTLTGMFMTNAGGPDAMHYGMMGDHVLGFRMVRADGSVLDYDNEHRSDNRFPKIKGLIAGSNGTLGIVTKLIVHTVPIEKQPETVVFTPTSLDEIPKIAHYFTCDYGDMVKGLEYISASMLKSYKLAGGKHYQALFPDNREPPENGIILVKFALPRKGNEVAQAIQTVKKLLNEQGLVNGEIIDDPSEASWCIRRDIFFAQRPGYNASIFRSDITLPTPRLMGYCPEFEKRLKAHVKARMKSSEDPDLYIECMAHLGYNVMHPYLVVNEDVVKQYPGGVKALHEEAKRISYTLTKEWGGSVCAEHGLGPHNMVTILPDTDPGLFRALNEIYQSFDPHRIMNPAAKADVINARALKAELETQASAAQAKGYPEPYRHSLEENIASLGNLITLAPAKSRSI